MHNSCRKWSLSASFDEKHHMRTREEKTILSVFLRKQMNSKNIWKDTHYHSFLLSNRRWFLLIRKNNIINLWTETKLHVYKWNHIHTEIHLCVSKVLINLLDKYEFDSLQIVQKIFKEQFQSFVLCLIFNIIIFIDHIKWKMRWDEMLNSDSMNNIDTF